MNNQIIPVNLYLGSIKPEGLENKATGRENDYNEYVLTFLDVNY